MSLAAPLAVVDVSSTDARVVALVAVLGFASALAAAWFGYLGTRTGRAAQRIAERVERQVTPNGGTQATTGDATVRMEADLGAMKVLVAQAVTELQAAVTRDDGRFARSERDMAELRAEVKGVTAAIGKVSDDHRAILSWIETHTEWAHSEISNADARAENIAARLAALEQAELGRRERGQ